MTQNLGHSLVFQGLSRLTLPATAQSLGLGSCLWQGLLLGLQRQGNTANLPVDGINVLQTAWHPSRCLTLDTWEYANIYKVWGCHIVFYGFKKNCILEKG